MNRMNYCLSDGSLAFYDKTNWSRFKPRYLLFDIGRVNYIWVVSNNELKYMNNTVYFHKTDVSEPKYAISKYKKNTVNTLFLVIIY